MKTVTVTHKPDGRIHYRCACGLVHVIQPLRMRRYPWRLVVRAHGGIEFVDADGVGHPSCWSCDTVHGCNHNCQRDDFPGRAPRANDIAYCGAGTLGLIESPDTQRVLYPDGTTSRAWTGIHLTRCLVRGRQVERGDVWSSRNPIIVGNLDAVVAGTELLNPRKFADA